MALPITALSVCLSVCIVRMCTLLTASSIRHPNFHLMVNRYNAPLVTHGMALENYFKEIARKPDSLEECYISLL